MAGGVGSRFWPFSRNNKPKQFLDFFGTGRSLLQMTIDRFRPIVPIEHILIVTNVAYRDQVLEQIPDLQSSQVLCEPARHRHRRQEKLLHRHGREDGPLQHRRRVPQAV